MRSKRGEVEALLSSRVVVPNAHGDSGRHMAEALIRRACPNFGSFPRLDCLKS